MARKPIKKLTKKKESQLEAISDIKQHLAKEILSHGSIETMFDLLEAKPELTKNWAQNRLRAIANANILDYIQVDKGAVQGVTIKDLEKLPLQSQYCIKSIKQTATGIHLELESKIGALGKIGESIGISEQPDEVMQKAQFTWNITYNGVKEEDLKKYGEYQGNQEPLRTTEESPDKQD